MALLAQILSGPVAQSGRRGLALLGLAAALALGAAEPAARAPTPEYQVKAAFLFNFAQFVEWGGAAFATPRTPIVIGVAGDDPFGPYLDNLVRNEKVGERALEVRRFHHLAEVTGCHILFVSDALAAEFDAAVPALQRQGILTIGEMEGFTRRGGVIRFVLENGKIRFRVNPQAAKDSGLVVSSKLLRWATIVTPEKK